MSITDLLPWRKRESKDLERRREPEHPMERFEQQMNEMFEEFFDRGFVAPAVFEESWSAFSPRLDVVERDTELEISAELPGLESEDIDISVSEDLLTISGEKRTEREEEQGSVYRMERSYGSFRRQVPLPCEIDADEAEATYKNGVLTIKLPKVHEGERCKRINVRSS